MFVTKVTKVWILWNIAIVLPDFILLKLYMATVYGIYLL